MMANKKMRRALSATLAMSMCMSMMATAVQAAEETAPQEDNKTTVTVTIGSGTAADPTVTTETTTSSDRLPNSTKTETTVETESSWTGETTEGSATTTVTGQSSSTETTITDRKDRPVDVSGSESGSESTVIEDTKVTHSQSSDPLVSETTKGDADSSSSSTDNDLVYDPTVTIPDEDIDLEYGKDYDDVTVDLKPGDKDVTVTDEVNAEDLVDLPAKPADAVDLEDGSGYTYTTELTEADGTVIETTVEIVYTKNADGEIIGYQTNETVVTTAPSNTVETEDAPVVGAPDVTVGDEVVTVETVIHLPQRPATGRPIVNPITGETTAFSVEDLFNDDGEIVGYKTTTTVTDKDGNVLSTSSNTIWGDEVTTTTVTTPTTTETTSTQKFTTTTTTQITTGVTQSGLIVTATDREVTASMGNVETTGSHGVEDVETALKPTQSEPGVGKTDTATDLYHRDDQKTTGFDEDSEYIFQWLGEYGLESAIRVNAGTAGNGTWQPHQFILRDKDGNPFYVYCADFEVSPQVDFGYDMENLEDATYYNSDDAKHIRAIAQLGYWGTDSGIGSLNHIKTYLKAAGQAATGLTDDQIDSLTPGEALTATQAALWTYGNSGDTKLITSDIVGSYNNNGAIDYSNASNTVVQKLYDYLINQTEDPSSENILIGQQYITGSSITVKDEVADNDTYNTDISFTLEFTPSQDNSDLIVEVLDEATGDVLAVKRLSGINDADETYEDITAINDTFTIEDVVLPNGAKVTLNLSGVQNLPEGGVYLYTSEIRTDQGKDGSDLSSQTFVGLATGERSVDLEVDLEFRVTEPEAQIERSETTGSKADVATKVDVRIDTTVETQVEKDMEVTEVTVSRSDREWSENWEETYSYSKPNKDKDEEKPETPTTPEIPETPETPETPEIPEIPEEPVPQDDDFPIEELPDEEVPLTDKPDELLELPEDPIPLANVPKTGISAIPQIMSLFSGLSLLGLGLVGRKKKD